jgi:hypothetical protein
LYFNLFNIKVFAAKSKVDNDWFTWVVVVGNDVLSSKDFDIEEIEVQGDNTPEYLTPYPIASRYSTALNTYLAKLLPTSRAQDAYAMIFNTKKAIKDIKFMFTTRHIVGRVWRIVFPEQDTYIYTNAEGVNTIVTIFRRVQQGRRYFGIDFYYSHYYLYPQHYGC